MKTTLILTLLSLIIGMPVIEAQQVFTTAGDYFTTQQYVVSFTIGEPVTETFSGPGVTLTQGFQQPETPPRVSGYLTYFNDVFTGLGNSVVVLRDLNGNPVASANTSSSGFFSFNTLSGTQFVTDANTQVPWGGSNAADALLALRHFVGLDILTGLQYRAANVDANAYVNASDALLILKRFVYLISSFPAGDWLFDQDTFDLEQAPVQLELNGICTGDVNGSYVPQLKCLPPELLTLDPDNTIQPDAEIQIPVYAARDEIFGSLSLVFLLPDWIKEVNNLVFTGDNSLNGEGMYYQYNMVGNELRVAAAFTEGMQVSKGGVLFTIDAVLNLGLFEKSQYSPDEALWIRTGEESLITDVHNYPLADARLSIPKFSAGPSGRNHCKIYPNPASQTLEIALSMSETSQVNIRIYNTLGDKLIESTAGIFPDGDHHLSLDVSSLNPGIYEFQLSAANPRNPFTIEKKLLIIR